VRKTDLTPGKEPESLADARGDAVHRIASAVAHRLAGAWLVPAWASPWRWSEDGSAVIWWGDVAGDGVGTTIAVAEEIHACARRLSPVGLPPLTALVLLLAAAGPDWPAHAPRLATWPFADQGDPALAAHRARAMDHLARLRGARGTVARAELAALVFPAGGQCSPPVAAAVLQGIDQGMPATQLVPAVKESDAARSWQLLAEGLEDLDAAHFAAAARTGIPVAPTPPALPMAQSGGMRGLIAALRDDVALGAVARLASALLAAAHLPRPLARPDELPQGGYAGIVNRGPLDRLIPAELAHDDLVLAARIAQGEALYLRRESPPAPRPRARAILIDSGIRMWGVPRVFALAVAMALAAEARPGARVQAWRAAGKAVDLVSLDHREGLLEHLSVLAMAPHPGAALPAWDAAVRAAQPAADGAEAGDRVLVTHALAVADPAFRVALAALAPPWAPALVATVANDGTYRLLALAQGGTRVLAEARFDLDDLVAGRSASLAERSPSGPLPVILALKPFPLLLPHHLDTDRAWHDARHGVLAAPKDGRLMWWPAAGKGARELLHRLPPGLPAWMGFHGSTAVALIAKSGGTMTLVRVPTASAMGDDGGGGGGAAEEIPISVARGLAWPLAVETVGVTTGGAEGDGFAALLVIGMHHAVAIDPVDGAVLDALSYDERAYTFTRQRLFETRDHRRGRWHLLGLDNGKLAFLALPRAEGIDGELFLRQGKDGQWALGQDGAIIDLAQERRVHGTLSAGRYAVKQVSRDGHRAIVSRSVPNATTAGNAMSEQLLDVEECRLLPPDRERLEPAIATLRRLSPNLVLRIDGVFAQVQADGSRLPAFRTAKYGVLSLRLHGDHVDLALSPRHTAPQNVAVARFHTWRGPGEAAGHRGLELAEGRQTRCVLDPRGLAHFTLRAGNLPQVTLVLSDGASAYWSSDGSSGGAPFFLTRPASGDPKRLQALLNNYAEGLL